MGRFTYKLIVPSLGIVVPRVGFVEVGPCAYIDIQIDWSRVRFVKVGPR